MGESREKPVVVVAGTTSERSSATKRSPCRYLRAAGFALVAVLLGCAPGGTSSEGVAQTAAAVSLAITLSNEVGRPISSGNGLARSFHAYDALGRDIASQRVLDNASYVYATAYGYPQSAISVAGPGMVVSSVTLPDSEVVAYTYDAGGASQAVTTTPSGGTQQTIVSKQVRNARGQTTEVDYGDGFDQVHCYDDTTDLRLNAIKTGTWSGTPSCTTAATSLVQSYSYAFDADANITTVNDYCTAAIPGVCCDPAGGSCTAQAMSATYGYDSLGQVTTAISNGTTNYYSYDNTGNLTCMQGTAAGCGNQTYPTQGAGSVHPRAVSSSSASGSSVTFSYDANGNTTSTSAGQTISWNAENMATQVLSGSTTVNQKWFVGEALWKKVEGETTTYYLPSLRNEGGGYRKDYSGFAERDWTDTTSCKTNASKGCLKFYHSDHLGSSAVATTSAGIVVHRASYWPYGGNRSLLGSFTPKYQFNFKEPEASGYYDYGARMYNDATGRWLSPDSVLTEPRYTYVNNKPLRLTDPTGHCGEPGGEACPADRVHVKHRHDDPNFSVTVKADVSPGPTAMIVGPDVNGAVAMDVRAFRSRFPNLKVLRTDQLGKGSLRGYNDLILNVHGSPQLVLWDEHGGKMGNEVADILKNAGFDGYTVVDLSCYGGAIPTMRDAGQLQLADVPSFAQSLSSNLHTTVYGAVPYDPMAVNPASDDPWVNWGRISPGSVFAGSLQVDAGYWQVFSPMPLDLPKPPTPKWTIPPQ
jgi:RHS repeat-associated protein